MRSRAIGSLPAHVERALGPWPVEGRELHGRHLAADAVRQAAVRLAVHAHTGHLAAGPGDDELDRGGRLAARGQASAQLAAVAADDHVQLRVVEPLARLVLALGGIAEVERVVVAALGAGRAGAALPAAPTGLARR